MTGPIENKNCVNCDDSSTKTDLEPCKECFKVEDETGKRYTKWSPRRVRPQEKGG
jgi:hypothetical protein